MKKNKLLLLLLLLVFAGTVKSQSQFLKPMPFVGARRTLENSLAALQNGRGNHSQNTNASAMYQCRVSVSGSNNWNSSFVPILKSFFNPSDESPKLGNQIDNGFFRELNNWSHSYTALEFDATKVSVDVEITKTSVTSITSAVIHPRTAPAAIKSISGNTVIVTVTGNCNFYVDINNDMDGTYTGDGYYPGGAAKHAFTVFANPIYNAPTSSKAIPLPPNMTIKDFMASSTVGSGDTIVIPDGVYRTYDSAAIRSSNTTADAVNPEMIVKTNVTIFLSQGAFLLGTLRPTGTNSSTNTFSVYGSGAISGEELYWKTSSKTVNKVFTNNTNSANFEGFIVLDPTNHTFNIGNSEKTDPTKKNTFKNLKVLGWRKNGDAMNADQNAIVDGCFFRVQDDLHYLGENVQISNTTTWTDANGLVMYLNNVKKGSSFKNIRVIYSRKKWHGWRSGAIELNDADNGPDSSLALPNGNTFVTCENIVVEDPKPTVGLFGGETDKALSNTGIIPVRNIIFKNIIQDFPRNDGNNNRFAVYKHNTISVTGFTIDNCFYNGARVVPKDTVNWEFKRIERKADGTEIVANLTKTERDNFFPIPTAFNFNSTNNNIRPYNVSANAGANGSITNSGNSLLNSGSSNSYTITPNSGYAIDAVYVNDVATNVTSNTVNINNINADQRIVVTFKPTTVAPIPCIIKPSVNTSGTTAGGTISPSAEQTVSCGTNSTTFNFSPNSNSDVDWVKVNGTIVTTTTATSHTVTNITGATTIEVRYKLKAVAQCTITPSVNISGTTASGTITPSAEQTVSCGTNSTTFNFSPNSNSNVDWVKVNGTIVTTTTATSHTVTNITGATTIEIRYKLKTFNVTSSVGTGGNGTINPLGVSTVTSGNPSPTYTFKPASGYVVDVVRVNNVAVTPTPTTTHTIPSIAANTTIQVTYKLAPAPVGGNVVLLGTDWFGTTGLTASITKPSPAGTMVVYVYGERNVAITTSQVSVSYGSVVMEKVEDRTVTNGYTAYVGAFILREASLPSTATSTLQVNWGSNTNIQITHTRAAFFSNVEQGAIGSSNHPIKSKSSNSLSNNTSAIQLPSTLANSTGDMIILGGYSSSTSGRWDTTAKTPTNFLQALPVPQVTQANTNDYDYLIAHKSATGAVEQPAIYYSSPLSRHICLGIVLNRAGDNINTEISGANAIAQDMASMSVYPNPANGSLTIIHPLNSKINIVNILGQQVYERVASGTQTVLNTNEIKAKGVVYINITSGGTSSVKKVIINE